MAHWSSPCMPNLAPQLCLLVPSRCVNAPFLAALCFSVVLTFSLALSLCSPCVFMYCFPLRLSYLFCTLCPFCTSLCTSLFFFALISTSWGLILMFVRGVSSSRRLPSQIAFSPPHLSFFFKSSLFFFSSFSLNSPMGVKNKSPVYVSSELTKDSAEEGYGDRSPQPSITLNHVGGRCTLKAEQIKWAGSHWSPKGTTFCPN